VKIWFFRGWIIVIFGTDNNMQVALITGGFDPLHSGHLAYIKEAQQFGRLVVAVNSDEWLARKKGRAFMPLNERVGILRNIKGVSDVVVFDDTDDTACDAIAMTHRLYHGATVHFINGGDRTSGNIPEMECSNIRAWQDVEFHFGVGGEDKKNSSSWILKEWKSPKIERVWGYYRIIHETGTHKVKELTVDPVKSLSLQKHQHRSEFWFVSEGVATVEEGSDSRLLSKRDYRLYEQLIIPVGGWHRLSNETDKPVRIIEIQYGDQCIEEDIERR
jgi:cytidyltransferase-like protein